jgi:hypothetical protein
LMRKQCPTLSQDREEPHKNKAISRLLFRANVHEPKRMHNIAL